MSRPSRTTAATAELAGTPRSHGIPFGEAMRVWARIAALSFGGPAGQIAVMHRILVEEKRWIGEARFLHALNFCMLLPGPEAQQLAIYIGWLLHRVPGGLVAGTLFVLPGFLAIMALSLVYATLGEIGLVRGLFFGLKAAVLAIVIEAVLRIGRRALKSQAMLALAAAAFVAIFAFDVPFPLIVLSAGLIGFVAARAGLPQLAGGGGHGGGAGPVLADANSALGEALPAHARPGLAWSLRVAGICLALWLGPVLLLLLTLGPANVFSQIALFFSWMAVVTFGGAYAVLAYVAQAAVETYGWLRPGEMLDGLGMAETTPGPHLRRRLRGPGLCRPGRGQTYGWLRPGEMLDGLGMAETTPGPLIMVLQFVGFMAAMREAGTLPPLLAGVLGGILTTWVTFVPCFLWIFAGAPFVETLRHNRALAGGLAAITAAVVGVILNLAVWFALHTLFAQVRELHWGPLALDVPILATLNLPALILTVAAILAVFRFRLGMLTVLAGAAAAGLLFHLAVGRT